MSDLINVLDNYRQTELLVTAIVVEAIPGFGSGHWEPAVANGDIRLSKI